MVSELFIVVFLAVFRIDNICCNCPDNAVVDPSIQSSIYPNPRRNETVQDTYGQVVIKDPYRWMENADLPETKKFIEEEMVITKSYLEKSPFRAEMKKRYTELYDYAKFNGLFERGKKFYSFQNTGLQNQDVLFVQDSLNCEPRIFLDPNTFSKDGTIALEEETCSFTEDGQILAYFLSEGGTDWQSIHFKHVEKGDIYKEKLTRAKFSLLAWTHNNKGLFYSGFLDQKCKTDGSANDEDQNQKLYYHVLGTDQSKDIMVVEFPENPDYYVYAEVSYCGKYLIVTATEGTDNHLIYVADLENIKYEINGKLKLKQIVAVLEANYFFITNNDNIFYFRTNKNADNYRVIAVDITNPDPKFWKDLVPEDKKHKLEWAQAAYDNYLVLCYIENVKSVLQLHDLTSGKMIKKFNLEIGTVDEETFFASRKSVHMFFNFESFLTPGIIYHCDLSKPSFDLEVFKEIKLKNFDREKFTTKQVSYKSCDGTEVPMYIVSKKDLQKNGNNLAFLYGYGAYGISTLPYFSPTLLLMIGNLDAVHAVANIRGGGEKGELWHRDGMLSKKQNSMTDFQAAAEYLIAEKYTNNKLLAINGASAGGLLIGACLTQRPDLYGAVIIDRGDMDMLRYDKFTSGKASVVEFGTASKLEDFKYLIKFSPLQNIRIPVDTNKQYPATLILTAEHDDRVPPVESYKFIAELQYQAKKHINQKNAFLIRVDADAGHGAGKPTAKIIEERLDMLCFIVINTGVKFHS